MEELVNHIKKIHEIVGKNNVSKCEFKPDKIIFETNPSSEEQKRRLRWVASQIYVKKFPNFDRIEYMVQSHQFVGLLKHAVEKAGK